MKNLFILPLFFILLACNGQAPVEEESTTASTKDSGQDAQSDGRQLYSQHCAFCHDELYKSDVTDANTFDITYAINTTPEMVKFLNELKTEQIELIATVLDSQHPSRVAPTITNALPYGRFAGATTEMDIEITTSIAATCYYSPLDVHIDAMIDTLQADSTGINHTTTITGLTPGAIYEYYVHCKENTYGNITTVSQFIRFTTDLDAVDSTPPLFTGKYNKTTLLGGTEKEKIYLNTNEKANCRYSTNSSDAYSAMTPMNSTGSLGHEHILTGLMSGNSYTFYFRCADLAGNESSQESISFSILNNIDAYTLYANNCQSCHGGLAGSGVRGASASDIQNAIQNVGRMQIEYLELLSPSQISGIAGAL